jgi:omega-amidase
VLVAARAIENQTPIVACNGVGEIGGGEFAGSSVVIDAKGNTLVSAGAKPGWHAAVIDTEETAAWRREFPLEQVDVG